MKRQCAIHKSTHTHSKCACPQLQRFHISLSKSLCEEVGLFKLQWKEVIQGF